MYEQTISNSEETTMAYITEKGSFLATGHCYTKKLECKFYQIHLPKRGSVHFIWKCYHNSTEHVISWSFTNYQYKPALQRRNQTSRSTFSLNLSRRRLKDRITAKPEFIWIIK